MLPPSVSQTTNVSCLLSDFFSFFSLEDIVGVHENEKTQYNKLMEVVNWFFFDLLVLGYVEDTTSGESFRLPGGLAWAVFVEVSTSLPSPFLNWVSIL